MEAGVTMGPVISARAKDSILSWIDTGKQEGRLLTDCPPDVRHQASLAIRSSAASAA